MKPTYLNLEAKEQRLMKQHHELMEKMNAAPDEEKEYWQHECIKLAKEIRRVMTLIEIRNDVEGRASA